MPKLKEGVKRRYVRDSTLFRCKLILYKISLLYYHTITKFSHLVYLIPAQTPQSELIKISF